MQEETRKETTELIEDVEHAHPEIKLIEDLEHAHGERPSKPAIKDEKRGWLSRLYIKIKESKR